MGWCRGAGFASTGRGEYPVARGVACERGLAQSSATSEVAQERPEPHVLRLVWSLLLVRLGDSLRALAQSVLAFTAQEWPLRLLWPHLLRGLPEWLLVWPPLVPWVRETEEP